MDKPTVERIARLVALAEYKRRQSAPGVKITPPWPSAATAAGPSQMHGNSRSSLRVHTKSTATIFTHATAFASYVSGVFNAYEGDNSMNELYAKAVDSITTAWTAADHLFAQKLVSKKGLELIETSPAMKTQIHLLLANDKQTDEQKATALRDLCANEWGSFYFPEVKALPLNVNRALDALAAQVGEDAFFSYVTRIGWVNAAPSAPWCRVERMMPAMVRPMEMDLTNRLPLSHRAHSKKAGAISAICTDR